MKSTLVTAREYEAERLPGVAHLVDLLVPEGNIYVQYASKCERNAAKRVRRSRRKR